MENKTDIPGLFKNEETGALINKDNGALIAYKKRKEADRRIQQIEDRIKRLEEKLKLYFGDNI